MSKFGFDSLMQTLKNVEKDFLREGVELAKKEFDQNFENKTDKGDEEGSGGAWEELKYRNEPPPILQLTGSLRRETKESTIQYLKNTAFFIIDPVDSRGRGYAEYHHKGTSIMAQRRTIVQSNDLDLKQMAALKKLLDKAFI